MSPSMGLTAGGGGGKTRTWAVAEFRRPPSAARPATPAIAVLRKSRRPWSAADAAGSRWPHAWPQPLMKRQRGSRNGVIAPGSYTAPCLGRPPAGTLLDVLLDDAPFMRAARRQPTSYTPVWLMHQAGRYLPEYRAIRARLGFLELCRNPEVAAEVTLQPVERLGVDAAILFADILLIVEPLGVGLEFAKGEGPVIHHPVRTEADVARLKPVDVASDVGFVFETVRRVRRALPAQIPLIGFAGAPFTVASYLVEGGPSRDYLLTKRLMREESRAWHALLELLVEGTARYLNGQLAAGAQAVQIFDSWVGVLGPD